MWFGRDFELKQISDLEEPDRLIIRPLGHCLNRLIDLIKGKLGEANWEPNYERLLTDRMPSRTERYN